MHSPTRSRSLRAAGTAAILTAGLVLAGSPLAAFADTDADAGSAGPAVDTTAIVDTSTGAGDGSGAGADEGAPADPGTESDPGVEADPNAEAEPSAETEPQMRGLMQPMTVPTYTVEGVTLDGYGRVLANVPVTLNQWVSVGGSTEFTTVFSATSASNGTFEFTVPDDYYTLCLDMASDAPLDQDRCGYNQVIVEGENIAGLRGMLGWRNAEDGSDAPTPDNAASLALTGIRAEGQAVTWTQAPDWTTYTNATGFNMVLGSSLWTVDGTYPKLQFSAPVETSHQLAAGDVTTQVGVKHFYVPDTAYPDAGWFAAATLTLTLPMPSAPAADSTALRSLPSGGVTTPASNTAGGTIQVTVGASHNGELVDGWLYSTPTFLGQAVVANGVATFRLPAGMTGSHTVAVSAGGTLIGWAPVALKASGRALAVTGAADSAALAAFSMLILLAGGALMFTASRRRRVSVA